MMQKRYTHGWVLGLLLFVVACDNTIEPVVNEGISTYAVHGFLDMRTEQQIVRVEQLRETILAETIPLDGLEVSSINLTDGTFEFWRDTLITLDDGSSGTAFTADFRPVPGHEYAFLIGRNGITESRATTRVPPSPPLTSLDPSGAANNMQQHLVLQGLVNQPLQVHVLYDVRPPDDTARQRIAVAYGEPGFSSNNGWELDVSLGIDRLVILSRLGLDETVLEVGLENVAIQGTLFSEEWKTPTTESNLENAHGFFGSIAQFEAGWTIDSTFVQTLGFVDNQGSN